MPGIEQRTLKTLPVCVNAPQHPSGVLATTNPGNRHGLRALQEPPRKSSGGADPAAIPPFDAVPLDLGRLWMPT